MPGKPIACSVAQQQVRGGRRERRGRRRGGGGEGGGRGGGGRRRGGGGGVRVIIRLSLQWVVSLELDVCTEKLVAVCQDAVYIIDTQVSITSAAPSY